MLKWEQFVNPKTGRKVTGVRVAKAEPGKAQEAYLKELKERAKEDK